MKALGIDIGGSGIKGSLVNTENGELVSERIRIPTPQPANPENVAQTVKELVKQFDYQETIGVSFPTVVIDHTARTFGNIDPTWIGTNIANLFGHATGHSYVVYNDADLAGIAEMERGAGQGMDGMVIMVTIGTGLGTGVFYKNMLIPNIELGRILGKDGRPIEFWAGDRARKVDNLEWPEWGERFDFFLRHLVRVFSPDHFILGGGASKKWDRFKDQITVDVPMTIASFKNNAGIIGAAMAAYDSMQGRAII